MPADLVRFEDLELDVRRYSLRRGGRTLKLERIPMELLLLLVGRPGEIVTREEIIEKLWGRDVFLDTDNGINTAIRKVRQALRDDPEQPRFVQTKLSPARDTASLHPSEKPLINPCRRSYALRPHLRPSPLEQFGSHTCLKRAKSEKVRYGSQHVFS